MALLLWTDGETGGPGTTLMAVAWTKTVVYLGYDCGVVAQLAEERVREVEAGDVASLSRLVRVWVIFVGFLPRLAMRHVAAHTPFVSCGDDGVTRRWRVLGRCDLPRYANDRPSSVHLFVSAVRRLRVTLLQVVRRLTGLRCSWITATVLRRHPEWSVPGGKLPGKRARLAKP